MFRRLSLRTPLGAGTPSSSSFAPSFPPGCPQRPSSTIRVADPRRLAGTMVPPSGGRKDAPRRPGGDPSLEEVLLEAGVAIQHQCEPDSASHPWPLNPASELLRRDVSGPPRRNSECLLDRSRRSHVASGLQSWHSGDAPLSLLRASLSSWWGSTRQLGAAERRVTRVIAHTTFPDAR